MVKEFNSFPPLRLYLFIREHSDIYSNILLPNNTLRFSNEMNMAEQTTQIILQENLILPITLAFFVFFFFKLFILQIQSIITTGFSILRELRTFRSIQDPMKCF